LWVSAWTSLEIDEDAAEADCERFEAGESGIDRRSLDVADVAHAHSAVKRAWVHPRALRKRTSLSASNPRIAKLGVRFPFIQRKFPRRAIPVSVENPEAV
jgi:hypothetical protein